MSTISDLKKNSSQLKNVKSTIERRLGKKEQILVQLKDTLGVDNLQEAKDILVELRNEHEALEKKAETLNGKMDTVLEKAKDIQA